jgi:hypothetical protein
VVQDRKIALNKLKRNISPDNLNNLKQLELKCKETIMEAKKTKLDRIL